jgi:hypothetical protein
MLIIRLFRSPQLEPDTHYRTVDLEQLAKSRRRAMVRAVAAEALALASISLFMAMVAVWAQVLAVV